MSQLLWETNRNTLTSLVLLRTKNRAGTLAHTVHRTEPLGKVTQNKEFWSRGSIRGRG